MTARWARWAAAAGIAAPFALLLPRHLDLHGAWAVAVFAVLMAALFLAIAVLEMRRAGAFAAIFVILVLLGFARAEHYSLPEALTDFALLLLAFYAGEAAARLHRFLGRAVLAAAVAALVAGAIVRAAHARLFGAEIGAEGYRAILQTTPAEMIEFFGRFVDLPLLAAATVLLLVAVAAALLALPRPLPGRRLAWGGLCAAAAAAVLFAHDGLLAERAQGFTELLAYAGELREYRELRDARRSQRSGPAIAQRPPLAGQPQTYVFVIGESLSRNHMSLYGYWRQTTPALERLASELAVFTDVVSPHSHTDSSLERVLTLANDANRMRFADPGNHSLVDLLRAAGFETWWISNQNRFGPWDNKTAALAAGAEHVSFLNKASGAFVTGPYDEVLLEPFAAALSHPAPRKAIFLHFLGSHWEYHRRYPPEAAVFSEPHGPREIGARHEIQTKRHAIVQYDNSVRYHDALVARIVETLRAARQPAALAMFADHGESLFEAKGHHWQAFTRDHVEVPLILWFSPEYRRLAGTVVERARAAARQPFALEDLAHLFADVALLQGAVFEPARSPLSAGYRAPRERRLFDGQRVYEDTNELLLNTRRALGRITAAQPGLRPALWAHRVDTLGKMMEAAQLFDGVEIDVVFDAVAGALMVNHPPQPPSGLTLDEQLAYANRLQPKLRFWLDLKNLGEGNAARVVEELKRLDARHAIRARALVETGHTGPAAALLRAAGFTSSYYLPNEVAARESCAGAAEIERILGARRFSALSYDFSGRRWVERCLAGAIRKLGLKSYTWDVERSLSERGYPQALDEERRRLYPRFAGILLPFRSLFDDWR